MDYMLCKSPASRQGGDWPRGLQINSINMEYFSNKTLEQNIVATPFQNRPQNHQEKEALLQFVSATIHMRKNLLYWFPK